MDLLVAAEPVRKAERIRCYLRQGGHSRVAEVPWNVPYPSYHIDRFRMERVMAAFEGYEDIFRPEVEQFADGTYVVNIHATREGVKNARLILRQRRVSDVFRKGYNESRLVRYNFPPFSLVEVEDAVVVKGKATVAQLMQECRVAFDIEMEDYEHGAGKITSVAIVTDRRDDGVTSDYIVTTKDPGVSEIRHGGRTAQVIVVGSHLLIPRIASDLYQKIDALFDITHNGMTFDHDRMRSAAGEHDWTPGVDGNKPLIRGGLGRDRKRGGYHANKMTVAGRTVLDTLPPARNRFSQMPNRRLESVAQMLGFPYAKPRSYEEMAVLAAQASTSRDAALEYVTDNYGDAATSFAVGTMMLPPVLAAALAYGVDGTTACFKSNLAPGLFDMLYFLQRRDFRRSRESELHKVDVGELRTGNLVLAISKW